MGGLAALGWGQLGAGCDQGRTDNDLSTGHLCGCQRTEKGPEWNCCFAFWQETLYRVGQRCSAGELGFTALLS